MQKQRQAEEGAAAAAAPSAADAGKVADTACVQSSGEAVATTVSAKLADNPAPAVSVPSPCEASGGGELGSVNRVDRSRSPLGQIGHNTNDNDNDNHQERPGGEVSCDGDGGAFSGGRSGTTAGEERVGGEEIPVAGYGEAQADIDAVAVADADADADADDHAEASLGNGCDAVNTASDDVGGKVDDSSAGAATGDRRCRPSPLSLTRLTSGIRGRSSSSGGSGSSSGGRRQQQPLSLAAASPSPYYSPANLVPPSPAGAATTLTRGRSNSGNSGGAGFAQSSEAAAGAGAGGESGGALPPRLRRKIPASEAGATVGGGVVGSVAGAGGSGVWGAGIGGGVSGRVVMVNSSTELEEKGIAGRASFRGVAGSKR